MNDAVSDDKRGEVFRDEERLFDQSQHDATWMARAVELAWKVRTSTSPNPWVGCVIVDAAGKIVGEGATAAPGGPHAEVRALEAAGERARGATAFVTLEPCAHMGRTPPCTEALARAGVRRVVAAIEDPDPKVAGAGLRALEAAGIEVSTGTLTTAVSEQLRPYLVHRLTGRPYVVLKLAMTLDGRTAAPDGSSRWITSQQARRDVHRLRGESDAVVVGAATVRRDDPALTVREVGLAGAEAAAGEVVEDLLGADQHQPMRVVLGKAPPGARVLPALELQGDLGAVLDELGARGVVQVLVEGGSHVAHGFHNAGLVNRYVWYVAPVFLGGDDGTPVFSGPGAPTMAEAWRGRLVCVRQLGPDLRIDVETGVDSQPDLASARG